MASVDQWSDALQQRVFGPIRGTDAALACDLAGYGLIRVAGEDAEEFLQGQLSNDVRKVDATRSQLTSYSNAKGRMLATARLLRRDKAFWLVLPREQVAPISRRLSMFVLRARVEIADASDRLKVLGIAGDGAAELLREAGYEPPDSIDAVSGAGQLGLVRLACRLPRFEVYGPPESIDALTAVIGHRLHPVAETIWTLLNIETGIPTVHAQTSEAFVAQMANLELVDGVSFTKGCYTGQEVIARMHYLGKPKRRMYGFVAESGQAPAPGTELFSVTRQPPVAAGTVVEAAALDDAHCMGLAVLQKKYLDDEIHIGAADGAAVQVRSLPYSIETEADGEDL